LNSRRVYIHTGTVSRMKVLIAITTLNQNYYTKQCLESLKFNCDVDVEIWDDCSKEEDVKDLAQKYGAKFYTKKKPGGLTDSWNRIYRRFKESDYDACFITNNDVIIAQKSLNEMIKALHYFPLVVPVSSLKGVGGMKIQSASSYGIPDRDASNPYLIESVQNKLLIKNSEDPYIKIPPFVIPPNCPKHPIDISKCIGRFHGFFFGINRDIFSQEYDNLHLFDPKYINVGNEDELSARLTIIPRAVKTAFVFHYKAITLGSGYYSSRKVNDRNSLERYHQ